MEKIVLDTNILIEILKGNKTIIGVIYKELTGKKIKNDIFKVKKGKELFYRSMLDIHMKSHQKIVLKIIKILKIDFQKESDRASRILFNTKKKKDFYLSKEP